MASEEEHRKLVSEGHAVVPGPSAMLGRQHVKPGRVSGEQKPSNGTQVMGQRCCFSKSTGLQWADLQHWDSLLTSSTWLQVGPGFHLERLPARETPPCVGPPD